MSGDPLTDAVRRLVADALDKALDPTGHAQLQEAGDRLGQPLRLAIAGRVKAGKSTLLNALVGEELAPTDAGECTRVVTWYVGGDSPRVIIHHKDGRVVTRPFRRDQGAIDVDMGVPAEEVDHLEISWPSSRLNDLTLIDTPGIASLSTDVSERASVVLSDDDDRPSVADAVLYLLRHAHSSDVRFLEAFHDDEMGRGSPLNAVGVLSRADEIGSGRLDALEVAARIADRYQSDPRIRRLCPVVVPVAGLLAQAGTTLRGQEYRALSRLADLPADDLENLLLTADRFVREDDQLEVTGIERAHLADRFGLYGVRAAVSMITSGQVSTATELAAAFTGTGGLDRLREVLLAQFLDRSRLLRARSALATVRAVVNRGGCSDGEALASEAEAITSSAHAFVEMRLLDDVRSGVVEPPERLVTELDRLLGGSGHSTAERLGLPGERDPDVLRAAAVEALARWQKVAESPLTARPLRSAARVVTRTCEGMLAELA